MTIHRNPVVVVIVELFVVYVTRPNYRKESPRLKSRGRGESDLPKVYDVEGHTVDLLVTWKDPG